MSFLNIEKKFIAPVMVAALGYFVDIYDLILFSVVRVPSLKSIGLSDVEILDKGITLLNLQMGGMLIGGIIFGIVGDKLGRLKVLFSSILLYSVANLANGFVTDFNTYALLRFIAGVGLAGELGAGVTLVSEILPKNIRGLGTTIIASVGVSGALLAWTIAENFNWQTAYIIGGVMGLMLLILRINVFESGLFENLKNKKVERGNFLSLFKNQKRFLKFLACIAVGIPLWYVVGILVTLSPEFSQELKVNGIILGGKSVFFNYSGLIFGDFLSGVLSQFLKSRKKSVLIFLIFNFLMVGVYFFTRELSVIQFYAVCFLLGIGSGYWAMFVTISAEQFGTNLRATVATSVPNFVRGSLVIMNLAFANLKLSQGLLQAGLSIGIAVMLVGFWGLYYIDETFHRDMDYLEN